MDVIRDLQMAYFVRTKQMSLAGHVFTGFPKAGQQIVSILVGDRTNSCRIAVEAVRNS